MCRFCLNVQNRILGLRDCLVAQGQMEIQVLIIIYRLKPKPRLVGQDGLSGAVGCVFDCCLAGSLPQHGHLVFAQKIGLYSRCSSVKNANTCVFSIKKSL